MSDDRYPRSIPHHMDHLLRMQVAYDVAQSRRRRDIDVKHYEPA